MNNTIKFIGGVVGFILVAQVMAVEVAIAVLSF